MQLDPAFEDTFQEALLNDVEQTLREEIGPQFQQVAEDNFKSYAQANGYDIDFIWEGAEFSVDRGQDSVILTVKWPGLTALFEFGVDPHVIEGNPELAFRWQSPPEGTRPPGAPEFVQTDEVNWGSETGGINEAGAIRDAINQLRRLLA